MKKKKRERKKNRKIDTKRGSQYHIRAGEQSRGTKSARRIDSRGYSLSRTLMNPERAGSENKAPRVVQFEVETLLKNETKNALERMGMEIREERGEGRNGKEERDGESWTTESTFISPTSWLLMGCSKTVRNNLKPPRLCGEAEEKRDR